MSPPPPPQNPKGVAKAEASAPRWCKRMSNRASVLVWSSRRRYSEQAAANHPSSSRPGPYSLCEAWPGGHIRTRTLLLVDERCFFFCRRDEPIAGASCVGTVARRHPFGTPHIPFLAFLQHTRGYAHVAPATAVTESTGESERAARRGGFLEDVPGDA